MNLDRVLSSLIGCMADTLYDILKLVWPAVLWRFALSFFICMDPNVLELMSLMIK